MQKHGTGDNVNKDGVLQRSAEGLPEKEKAKLARNRDEPATGGTAEDGAGTDSEIERAKGTGAKKV